MISGHKITQIPPHIKTSTQGACVKNGNIMTKRQKGQKKVENGVLKGCIQNYILILPTIILVPKSKSLKKFRTFVVEHFPIEFIA